MTILLSGESPFSFSIPTRTKVSILALPVIRPGGNGTLVPIPSPPTPSFSKLKLCTPAKIIYHLVENSLKLLTINIQKHNFSKLKLSTPAKIIQHLVGNFITLKLLTINN